MSRHWWCGLAAAVMVSSALAQAPQRVERADQLPRFSYPVQGELEAVVRDPQRFRVLAAQVQRDAQGVLAGYDIAERATRRQLLGLLMQIDLLEGRYDEALQRSVQIQELQERPADKLMSGLMVRAIVGAAKKGAGPGSAAQAAEVSRLMSEELARHPYMLIRNDVMRSKAGLETFGEALALGRVREVLQPVASTTGSLSSDLIGTMIGARFALVFTLPLKPAMVDTYGRYLAANQADKPDIWAARDVSLQPGRPWQPVTVVVWDSGVDSKLFADRLATTKGRPAVIAFDRYQHASAEEMFPLPEAQRPRLPLMQQRSKGFSDLSANIDSPEAREVKQVMSQLEPAQYKSMQEELRMTSVYQHGTHVAGITMAGNPYARLGNARIEFGHTLRPDPCPSPELQARSAANSAEYVRFIKSVGARVVNMSWGGSLRSIEVALEQCGMGKDAAERKALARGYFDRQLSALTAALASAPEVLFVAAAGNAANDPTFNEVYPSAIVLPNLVAVGAVDKAGDEASFTSYGPTVLLHANGYQVDSVVPGGNRVALSGTSMAAPQVANLAAKLLAVKPSLQPAEVIDIIRRTADRSEDGRRTLIHPARALAAVGYKP